MEDDQQTDDTSERGEVKLVKRRPGVACWIQRCQRLQKGASGSPSVEANQSSFQVDQAGVLKTLPNIHIRQILNAYCLLPRGRPGGDALFRKKSL
jgi:hypothetical protein